MTPLPEDPRVWFVTAPTRLSLRELAELYQGRKSCSKRTLERRYSRENWELERRRHGDEVARRTSLKAAEGRASVNARHIADYKAGAGVARRLLGVATATLDAIEQLERKATPLEAGILLDVTEKATKVLDRCARGEQALLGEDEDRWVLLLADADQVYQRAQEQLARLRSRPDVRAILSEDELEKSQSASGSGT